MAYKKFHNIEDKSLDKLVEKGFDVIEKLDMIHFRVSCKDNGEYCIQKSPDFAEISNFDCAINSVYSEIRVFVDRMVAPVVGQIFDKFGACDIGMFYLPQTKTNCVDYTTMEPGTFILNDVYTVASPMKDSVDINEFLCGLVPRLRPTPVIGHFDGWSDVKHILEELRSAVEKDDIVRVLGELVEHTYTGIPMENVPAVIIRSGKYNYIVDVNAFAPSDDQYIKALYRDKVVLNILHTVYENASVIKPQFVPILREDADPLNKICDLFAEYMNSTDLFKTDIIDEDDLLPPHNGYIGDPDMSVLTTTTKLIVRNNPVYQNILRLFMNEFRTDRYHDNVLSRDYTEDDKRRILKLISKLR